MSIASNIPATIYYILFAGIPTIDSPIYIDTFEMPDGQTSVTLSAFGVDADGYISPTLTQVFAADASSVNITRHMGLNGVIVDEYDDPTNIQTGYDADGNPDGVTDIERIDLEEIHKSRGALGIAEGLKIEVGIPDPVDTAYPFDDDFQPFSDASDPFFNPYAKMIIVDNRKDNVIRIINRPYGSMRTNAMDRNVWSRQELRGSDSTYVSGGFVRTMYSAKSNTMVSYYCDHNTNRWIKSINELPQNIQANIGFNQTSVPSVFTWIGRGRHSTIPI